MRRISDFDRPHPKGIDEHFHILDTSAVGRVLYWMQFLGLVGTRPGAIVECGPVDAVLNRPAHPYTQKLVAAATVPG